MRVAVVLTAALTLLACSLVLNSFLLRGYEFVPPATHDEQIAEARRIMAESVISPDEPQQHRKGK